MNNDKVIEEMLARIQALEEKVAALSGEDKKKLATVKNNVCQDTTNVSLNKNGFKFCA